MNAAPDATQKDAKAWANEIRRTVYNLGNEQ
jgi:hypothetical protein